MSITLAEIKGDLTDDDLNDVSIDLHDPHIYILKQDKDWIALSGTMLIELNKQIEKILK